MGVRGQNKRALRQPYLRREVKEITQLLTFPACPRPEITRGRRGAGALLAAGPPTCPPGLPRSHYHKLQAEI